jgi:hypothetical protein
MSKGIHLACPFLGRVVVWVGSNFREQGRFIASECEK